MTRYALIDVDGSVVHVLNGKPSNWPDWNALGRVQPCAADVQPGWQWTGAAFDQPRAPASQRIERTSSSLEFRRRFTAEERGAITLAASRGLEQGRPQLQVWLDDLSAAGDVDLDDPLVAEGLNMLVHDRLLAADRVLELLA